MFRDRSEKTPDRACALDDAEERVRRVWMGSPVHTHGVSISYKQVRQGTGVENEICPIDRKCPIPAYEKECRALVRVQDAGAREYDNLASSGGGHLPGERWVSHQSLTKKTDNDLPLACGRLGLGEGIFRLQ
jgi:hypothetical protein